MMRYGDLWRKLEPMYGEREAQAVVRTVLDDGFGLSLAEVLSGGMDGVDGDRLHSVMQRLMAGEPVQYVLGRARFRDRMFGVKPGVLIPRPETGELCQWVIDEETKKKNKKSGNEPLELLDVGTGSGCIAVSLALEMDGAQVAAIDVSPDALANARDNAQQLGAQVDFRLADILADDGEWPGERRFDIIVSNPPYICLKEQKAMARNVVAYEPHLALFVPDDNPLLFYRAIARKARRWLKPGGRLYFEINPPYARRLRAMLKEEGFDNCRMRRDSFGKMRMARAILP